MELRDLPNGKGMAIQKKKILEKKGEKHKAETADRPLAKMFSLVCRRNCVSVSENVLWQACAHCPEGDRRQVAQQGQRSPPHCSSQAFPQAAEDLSFLSLTKTNQSHLPVHKFSNIAKKLKTNLHFKSISKEIISAMVLSSI